VTPFKKEERERRLILHKKKVEGVSHRSSHTRRGGVTCEIRGRKEVA